MFSIILVVDIEIWIWDIVSVGVGETNFGKSIDLDVPWCIEKKYRHTRCIHFNSLFSINILKKGQEYRSKVENSYLILLSAYLLSRGGWNLPGKIIVPLGIIGRSSRSNQSSKLCGPLSTCLILQLSLSLLMDQVMVERGKGLPSKIIVPWGIIGRSSRGNQSSKWWCIRSASKHCWSDSLLTVKYELVAIDFASGTTRKGEYAC